MANHIKAKREACGLSRVAFARALGVDAATVWRWERDECLPHWKNVKRIAAVLHCSIEELWPELATPHAATPVD